MFLVFDGGDGVAVLFQPIADLSSGDAIGMEALARFDPAQSLPPLRWFERAAALGLLVDLELAVARAALSRIPEVPDGAFLSLNVSPLTLTS